MSHTCTYLGGGGFVCLLYMPFKYFKTKGCPGNFRYPLILTNGLQPIRISLYKQELRNINFKTKLSSGEQGSPFHHIVWSCHRLSTYLCFGICLWFSRFQENFTHRSCVCLRSFPISELHKVSFSNKIDISISNYMLNLNQDSINHTYYLSNLSIYL